MHLLLPEPDHRSPNSQLPANVPGATAPDRKTHHPSALRYPTYAPLLPPLPPPLPPRQTPAPPRPPAKSKISSPPLAPASSPPRLRPPSPRLRRLLRPQPHPYQRPCHRPPRPSSESSLTFSP